MELSITIRPHPRGAIAAIAACGAQEGAAQVDRVDAVEQVGVDVLTGVLTSASGRGSARPDGPATALALCSLLGWILTIALLAAATKTLRRD